MVRRRADAARLSAALVIVIQASPTYAVLVDDYGAQGDGVSWDHRAIQEAIDAAGPGGLVEFTPGKIYVQCARILPHADQTIRGNGATLKRCDSVTARLTEPATAGDTSLTVDNPWVFEVGQSVTPVKGDGGYADGEFVVDHWVLSVTDNNVTIFNELRQSYPTGSIVAVKFAQIHVPTSSTNVTIEGLTLDGNRANNDVYLSWTDNQAILGYSGLTVTNCRFLEVPGNGITAFGTDVLIDNNLFFGLDGPIVHLSGNNPTNGSSVTISRNRVDNTNRQWQRMKHSEGVITISAENNSINVIGNTARNAPVPFISRFHSFMRDWLIVDNEAVGTRGAFEAKAFPGAILQNVVFENNTFVDVGLSRTYSQEGADPSTGFVFRGNKVIGGSLLFMELAESAIVDNTIKSCETAPLVVPEGVRVTAEPNVLIDDYCLLSVSMTAYPTTIEAPGRSVIYVIGVVNTEDADAVAGVSVVEVGDEQSILSGNECGYALPQAVSAGQSLSCRFRRTVIGSAGEVAENTATVRAETASGNKLSFTAVAPVRIVDTTPPRIELLGPNPVLLEPRQPYEEFGALAMDTADGDLSEAVVVDSSEVQTAVPGKYTVVYAVVDSAGNSATLERVVIVRYKASGGGGALDLVLIILGAAAAMLRRPNDAA